MDISENLNENWLARIHRATISAPKSFSTDFENAFEWVSNYQSLEQAWGDCLQGDWLIWLALLFVEDEDFHRYIVSAIFMCCETARQYVEKGAEGPAIATQLFQQWLENEVSQDEVKDGISTILASSNPGLYDAKRDRSETLGVRHGRQLACAAYTSCLYAILVNDHDFVLPVLAAYNLKSAASAIADCRVGLKNRTKFGIGPVARQLQELDWLPIPKKFIKKLRFIEVEQEKKEYNLRTQRVEDMKKEELSNFAEIIRAVVPCPKPRGR